MTIGHGTATFYDEPQLPSAVVNEPKAMGYGALVDETWMRLALSKEMPVRFYTKDSMAPRQDTSGSSYERVLDIGDSWGRGDLSGGEGLDWDPRLIAKTDGTDALDKIRYFDSSGLSLRRPDKGEAFRMSLAKDMALWKSVGGLVDLATSATHLFVAYGTTVEWWASWDDASPAGAATASSTVVQLAVSPFGDVAVVTDTGTVGVKEFQDTVFTTVSGLSNAEGVWWAKGRFVVSTHDSSTGAGALYETDAAAAPFDTFRGECYSVVSSGPAIVAAISDGTVRSYVPEQGNQADPSSVNLVIRGRADVAEGETPFLLGANASALLVLTHSSNDEDTRTIRAYQGEILPAQYDYVAGQFQLRREWEDAVETIDKRANMAATRDELWFWVEEADDDHSLWRFDVVTSGLSRCVTKEYTSDAHSIVSFDDVQGFISGTSVYKRASTYVDEGWLITPNINFGLNTPINWVALTLNAFDLVSGGAQVEMLYSAEPEALLDHEHESWTLGIRVSAPPQSEIEQFLSSVQAHQLALQIRLYSAAAGSVSPKVASFAVRGIPAHRDWILELPVNVSDLVEVPGRRPVRIPGYGNALHMHMLGKVGDSLEVTVLDPPIWFRGVVDNIVEPVEYVTDRGAASVRCVLQCRGSRAETVEAPTGDAGLGMGLLGVATLGIGQTEGT